jgi:hypothetical protein
MIKLLHQWAMWQRTARNPKLDYSLSQQDSPLQKKRIITPIFRSNTAENLDYLMVKYLTKDYIFCLTLTYVEKVINQVAADTMGCSIKSFIIKRNEAISALRGIYSVAKDNG